MFKSFKEWLESKGINKESFENKTIEEKGNLQKEYMAYVSAELKENGATKEQLKSVEDKLEGLADKKSIEKIQKDVSEALEGLAQLKEKGVEGSEMKLADEIKAKKDAIIKVAEGGAGEVAIKALTNRAAVSNSTAGYYLPEITQLGTKERSLYNVLPKVTLSDGDHTGVIRYRDWDEATTVRAAAMVAEGAAFPESTAKFKWYSQDLKKIGDTLPVTAEFFEDEVQASSELEMFLDVNVNLVVDNQIINGNNTGQNLEGLITAAPAYTAVASSIPSANLKDLAIKVRNDITRSRGSKYRPDILVVSSSTMEDLVLAKDANKNYIFDESTGTLGGLTVIVDENMADNSIIVGDRRYARIYEKSGVVISRGLVGSQFTEDEMTLKARKRMLLLVKNGDKTGFRKVADVDAALTTLASDPA